MASRRPALSATVTASLILLFGSAKSILERKHPVMLPMKATWTEAEANLHASTIKASTLGFDYLVSDLIWIGLLQDASHETFKGPGLCWEYVQLDTVSRLDPMFQGTYYFGSSFLSVFRRDAAGAERLLTRFTQKYPMSWRAHYLLGAHQHLELHQEKEAAEQMLLAAKLEGAPEWLSSLGIRLLAGQADLWLPLRNALELYPFVVDTGAQLRLRLRIRSLWYHIQKNATEQALRSALKERELGDGMRIPTDITKTGRELASLAEDLSLSEDLEEVLRERFQFRWNGKLGRIEGELSDADRALEQLGAYRAPKETP